MSEESPSTPPPKDNDDNNIVDDVTDAVSDAAETIKEAATASPPSADGVALGAGKLQESDERTMGMLAHLLGAFTGFVGPLIIWLIKKEESPFVDDQGKESLNFQIVIAIAMVISIIGSAVPVIGCVFAILPFVIALVSLIFCILACLQANKGIAYRYPFNLRLIS